MAGFVFVTFFFFCFPFHRFATAAPAVTAHHAMCFRVRIGLSARNVRWAVTLVLFFVFSDLPPIPLFLLFSRRLLTTVYFSSIRPPVLSNPVACSHPAILQYRPNLENLAAVLLYAMHTYTFCLCRTTEPLVVQTKKKTTCICLTWIGWRVFRLKGGRRRTRRTGSAGERREKQLDGVAAFSSVASAWRPAA